MYKSNIAAIFWLSLLSFSLCTAQEASRDFQIPQTLHVAASSASYVLGPEDTLRIHVLDAEELGALPYPIDIAGNINLPRIGRIHAAGLTADQLESELTSRFKEFLQHPAVTVSVAEFHSQPVSVLGQVDTPGVIQLHGRRTLAEVISEAGGLKADAGDSIRITRQNEYGLIPLPSAKPDASGKFSVAEVNVQFLMKAKDPRANILVKPFDVITVPKAELVYVIGAVNKAGGFVLSEKKNMSVLEALSLAQGTLRTAKSSKTRILRETTSTQRLEISVDLKQILDGKKADIALQANDIVFVPSSTGKVATIRAIEAIIQTGSGVATFHSY